MNNCTQQSNYFKIDMNIKHNSDDDSSVTKKE